MDMEEKLTHNSGMFIAENGEPNAARINKLPLVEYMRVIGIMTDSQFNEYLSKSPVNESQDPVRAIKVNFPIENIGTDADLVISELRRKYLKK